MTEEQREIRRKKRVIEYAERNGNIKTACRRFGIARSTFYLWPLAGSVPRVGRRGIGVGGCTIRKISFAIAIALVTTPSISNSEPIAPKTLIGEVVKVTDGDSLRLLVAGNQIKIRLAQIDAPEIQQPYGRRAKSELARLALGKRARVEVVDIDRYGRTVGEVHIAGLHVNQEMVRLGYAWAYTRYSRSMEIIDLENDARSKGIGLWRLPESERAAPWNWRHGRVGKSEDRVDDRCGDKWSCGEMGDCAEARFYLLECGRGMLDGDGDGVPCEALCESGGSAGP